MRALIPLAALLAAAIIFAPGQANRPPAETAGSVRPVREAGSTGGSGAAPLSASEAGDGTEEPAPTAVSAAGDAEAPGEEETGEKRPPAEPVDPHRRRSTIYVAARGSAEVRVFSRDTGEEIATVPVGKLPSGLAARRDGDRIYVACAGSHTLEVLDGATRKVLDRVSFQHGSAPAHVVLGPREEVVYVAASGTDEVIALDTGSLQELGETAVGREPSRLAISPDGRTLYVLCVKSGRVDLVDTATMGRVGSVAVGTEPADLALDPATGELYVVRPEAPVLTVLAPGATQAREVSIDMPAESLAVDSQARRVLLATPSAAQIAVVSAATGASTKVIDAPGVTRLAVDPEGARVYALSLRRDMLLVVDQMLGSVEMEIPAGRKPWDLVLIP